MGFSHTSRPVYDLRTKCSQIDQLAFDKRALLTHTGNLRTLAIDTSLNCRFAPEFSNEDTRVRTERFRMISPVDRARRGVVFDLHNDADRRAGHRAAVAPARIRIRW